MSQNKNSEYCLKRLSASSNEFDKVYNLIETTCPGQCIISIDKVINPFLEERYNKYKESLGDKAKEIDVYHGSNLDGIFSICTEGFIKSKNKVSAFGKGSYVATAFAYSKAYSKINGNNYHNLIVCKLSYLNIKQGSSNSICPKGYDVQVDNTYNPGIFSVDKDEALLPLYIVQFMKMDNLRR
jgi:hypothetical protein